MTYHAIKPVYNRKLRTYEIDHRIISPGDIGPAMHSGYYTTDNMAATLGYLVAGKLEWYNRMSPEKMDALERWLKEFVAK